MEYGILLMSDRPAVKNETMESERMIPVWRGIVWGLVALFDLNLVTLLFGAGTLITEIVYVAVALSAIYHLVAAKAVANRFADRPQVA